MSNKCVIGINEVDFGSTGNITYSILDFLSSKGFETYFAGHELTKNRDNEFQISIGKFNYLYNKILSRIDSSDGFHSILSTKRLIKFLDEKKPSLLILGNLHGSYLNIPLLFEYIKCADIKCIYTLHDCWSFTGKCANYIACNCNKWKTKCYNCPNLKTHPRAYLFDHSRKYYLRKKDLFAKMQNQFNLIAPSKFMESQIKESFLKAFKIRVINNGAIFNDSNIASTDIDLKNENRIILFSAAMPFNEQKGICYLNKLANELDSSKFLIIAAGVPSKYRLSKNIIYLDKITNRNVMDYYYSNSDYFLNLSLEDNFPTTNTESLMNGTPIICFEQGGNTELINDANGLIVKYKNYNDLYNKVISLQKKTNDQIRVCKESAKDLTMTRMCEKYYELISEILKC